MLPSSLARDQADLGEHFGAQPLLVDAAVLVFGEQARRSRSPAARARRARSSVSRSGAACCAGRRAWLPIQSPACRFGANPSDAMIQSLNMALRKRLDCKGSRRKAALSRTFQALGERTENAPACRKRQTVPRCGAGRAMSAANFTAPSPPVRGTRRAPSLPASAQPTHNPPLPSRNGRGSCRPRGRRRSARARACCRGDGARRQAPAAGRAAGPALFQMRHRDGEQRDGPLGRMVGQRMAHQLLGDFGEHRRRRDRLVERERPRHRAHVGKAHPHGHRPSRPRLGPQPRGDPVGEVEQRRAEHALLGRPLADRRLRAGRLRPAMRA